MLHDLGKRAANVRMKTNDDFTVEIKKSDDSNIEFGMEIMELALEITASDCGIFDTLPVLYKSLNQWDKMLKLYERVIELNILTPMRLTGIFFIAFRFDRRDIIEQFTRLALGNKKFLKNPYSLSNIIYSLNRKDEAKTSEIALKLTNGYWNLPRRKVIMTLYINMIDAYIVANELNDILDDMVKEVLNIIKKDKDYFHPAIYENLAWYYLKKEATKKAINYLKKAKVNGHPEFMKIKNSKYFRALADNPEFLKLFD